MSLGLGATPTLIAGPLAAVPRGTVPPGADAPAIDASLFARFTAPKDDAPFLEATWPERWAPPGPIRAVVVEQTGQFSEPFSRRSGLFPATFLDDESAAALRAFASLPERTLFTAEHPGGQSWVIGEVSDDGPVTKGPRLKSNTVLIALSARRSQATDTPPELDDRASPVVDRTWFVVTTPAAQADPAKLRGVAVIMPGLFGLPPTIPERLAELLSKDGWLALRMLSQPSSFVEKIEFDLDPNKIQECGTLIAQTFGERSAECAYAVQAATAHLEAQTPALVSKPRIIIGISAGAMTLPTVVAREPSRYAAAVLIGGGCNYWHISETSNYTTGTETVRWEWLGGAPAEDVKQHLRQAYLDAASLDSYHTAASLRGKPTLFIHANADQAVPSPLGDVLWKRAGQPDRWSFVGSHEGVTLMGLPPVLPRIVEWFNAALSPAPPRADP